MMILCCALIAASTFGAKILGRGDVGAPMHAFQITFGRYFFALCVLTTGAVFMKVGRPQVSLPLYAARTFCGWAGVSGLFAAAALIPLADATAISFLSPVFAMLLAVMFLSETVGRNPAWVAGAFFPCGGLSHEAELFHQDARLSKQQIVLWRRTWTCVAFGSLASQCPTDSVKRLSNAQTVRAKPSTSVQTRRDEFRAHG